jgi:hypothetical protein
MPSPTGGAFRNSYFGSVLARLAGDTVVALAAAESHESSYSSGNFSTLLGALEDAVDAVNAAAVANGDGGNP